MDKKEVLNSNLLITEDKCESLYPVYFGVSCAFFALRLLSVSGKDENCEKLVQGSAQLLGLLIWMNKQKSDLLHKIEIAEREIETLKRTRREDAKANEKVVRIFATQEQSWFVERKKLRQHLGGLMKELRIFEKKEEEVFEMNDKLKEMELLMESMEKNLEEEIAKRKELEEKLSNAETVAEELREKAKVEAREHSSGLWKLKTAFIELVSNQRQLEAETRRSVKQVEATKQELDSVLLQKEESVLLVQKLSAQLVRSSNDLEQKGKILSAMLRKSKLDRAEKQMLLNEVQLSKAKRKQAELEMERWKFASESRHERQSLRSVVSSHLNPRSDVSSSGKAGLMAIDHVIESNYLDFMREFDFYSPLSDGFTSQGNEIADLQQLNVSVQTQAEKEGLMLLQQRHNEEMDAFAEQMRAKDEKLEALRWQLLSMELEMKRLHSHAAGLSQDVLQLKRDNMKLEALSVAREEELASLKMELIKSVEAEAVEPERSAKMVEEEDVASDKNSSINHFHYSSKELEERKDVACQSSPQNAVKIESPKLQPNKYRVDLHALGVSFKIKRLKQQLVMLERLAGRRDNEGFNNEQAGTKDFVLLNKQVGRYESLQGKADDLCQRMHESDEASTGDSDTARKKTLLEETLQLQRYVVATGQKLVEVKSRICSAFSEIDDQLVDSSGHDVKCFSDSIRSQYEEVQRGVEVRIARMIGDLEGTLAREGISRLQI